MPGMDGVETFHAITDDSTNINRNTPVILLTANIAMEIEGEYAKEGFSAYLSKPIEFKKMEIVVKDLLPSEKIR
jgi:CheY-like chemotaxis protein